VNKGKKRKGLGQNSAGTHQCFAPWPQPLRPSEFAELARFESIEYQLEGLGANSGAAGEGMLHGTDGEQYQGDHPR
jgi:hypothetical protein